MKILCDACENTGYADYAAVPCPVCKGACHSSATTIRFTKDGGLLVEHEHPAEKVVERVENPDESEPWCSACEGSESPAAFHTYDGGCDHRYDP